jgi:sporulation protein YpjB
MRRLWLTMAVFFLSFGLSVPVYGENHSEEKNGSWSEINVLTNEIWELGKTERYEEAAFVLKYATDSIIRIEDITLLRPDQKRMVEYTLSDALRSLQNPVRTKEIKLNKLTEVRLMVDALQTDYEPLWKKTGLMMLEPFIDMKRGINDKDEVAFHEAANLLLQRYETVRPALSVDLGKDELGQLDEHVAFIDQSRTSILMDENHQKHFEAAAADFEALFFAKKDTSEPSLFWLIFSIGGVISSTLFYVGWRKYKGDKEELLRVPEKR